MLAQNVGECTEDFNGGGQTEGDVSGTHNHTLCVSLTQEEIHCCLNVGAGDSSTIHRFEENTHTHTLFLMHKPPCVYIMMIPATRERL